MSLKLGKLLLGHHVPYLETESRYFSNVFIATFPISINIYLLLELLGNSSAVADPGFPKGGVDLVGGVDSRGGYVSKNLYVEMKESEPGARPLDPPMKWPHNSARFSPVLPDSAK